MNRPVFARLYPRMSKATEQAGMAEHRHTLLAGLTCEVIEIGAGGVRTSSTTRPPSPAYWPSNPNHTCGTSLKPPPGRRLSRST